MSLRQYLYGVANLLTGISEVVIAGPLVPEMYDRMQEIAASGKSPSALEIFISTAVVIATADGGRHVGKSMYQMFHKEKPKEPQN